MIYLTEQPIDIQEVLGYVQSAEAGAIDLFIGTVRNHTGGRRVVRLEYEAYDGMAIKEMQKIAEEAAQGWQLLRYAVVHRKGVLAIGEAAVAIAVACGHRQAAFEACKFIIDTIKARAPIWKKEIYEDGEVWVAAHP